MTTGSCIFRYETELLASKFCVPTPDAVKEAAVATFKEQYDKYFGETGAMDVFNDIVATWRIVAGSVFTAFLLGFVFMIFLRFCGGPIIWSSIIVIIGGTIYGGYGLFEYAKVMDEADSQYIYKDYYTYGSYAVWGLALIMFVCVCCNLKNIRIGLAVMQCTAMFINGTPQVFLMPILALVVTAVFFLAWIYTSAFVMSIGEI